MNEDIVEVTVRIRGVGPRSRECVDLIMDDISTLIHLAGTGDSLSGAMVTEVR